MISFLEVVILLMKLMVNKSRTASRWEEEAEPIFPRNSPDLKRVSHALHHKSAEYYTLITENYPFSFTQSRSMVLSRTMEFLSKFRNIHQERTIL
ncbi:MAG: hypothetical protein D6820_07060 [Lentisphaerae bacterium]|nr:MAG: hypothetical protein D6820_07060 [Lentisphaerota bacterium]